MGKTQQGRWCGVAVGVGSTRLDGEAFEELGQNGGVARVRVLIKATVAGEGFDQGHCYRRGFLLGLPACSNQGCRQGF